MNWSMHPRLFAHSCSTRFLLALAVGCLAVSTVAARVFTNESVFRDAVVAPTTVSFNLFSVGFLPQTTLHLGDVAVRLTNAGSAPIFGPPGPFGFTTNYLSTGVQDGDNNVVITFPGETKAAGMKIVSVFPVTVTVSYVSGSEVANFSASHVSFLGFAESPGMQGLRQITISSPFDPTATPIVNIGDITYALELASSEVSVPTLSISGIVLVTISLLLTGCGFSAARARSPRQTNDS